jgi:hypothetical protein
MAVVIHSCEEKNLKKLKRNEEADCQTCALAEKTLLVDGCEGYMCKAALYDIETLACYVKGHGDNE